MSKYITVVGETGNEQGHVAEVSAANDAAAIRKAKRAVAAYRGDGWWIVRDDSGREVARGGRVAL
jgi:hypothetical protein